VNRALECAVLNPAVSVVIASDRVATDLADCLASLARQTAAPEFEILVAARSRPPLDIWNRQVRWIPVAERNPALRRNRAAAAALGEWLAFIDDDARAFPDWMNRGTATAADIVGGCDELPRGAPYGERLADLLLATPVIGSGVAAHERSPRGGEIGRASDLALCNLFVRRALFEALGGFDESLGYIGEDTDFIRRALHGGARAVLDPALRVAHRRRAFPADFLRQRWRYRAKTGYLWARDRAAYPDARLPLFLLGGTGVLALAVLEGVAFLLPFAVLYAAATWVLSYPIWRRDWVLAAVVPFAFAAHHLNYWLALLAGAVAGLLGGGRRRAG
jgi:GT2 family glycosyltransferase